MNRKVIPCLVRDEYIIGAGVTAGAAGSGGEAVLQLEFGPMWEGLVKYVTFRDALKENPVTVLLTTDMMERLAVPVRPPSPCPEWTAEGGGPHGPPPEGEAPETATVLVYNVPIPAKAQALAGMMGVVVQGYDVRPDGSRVEAAAMTANAYYKILPADHAPVEDGSVTPTLSQQLQGQIEAIRKDILGAAGAAGAKEASEEAARRAEQARDGAEEKAREAEESAGRAEKDREKAEQSAQEAKSARTDAQTALLGAQQAQSAAGDAREKAEQAQAAAEDARDRAEAAQLGAEEAERRGKGYRDEAVSARDAAREAQEAAEREADEARGAKETAEECRTQAWIERLLAQEARLGAEEAQRRAETARTDAETARGDTYVARDEVKLIRQELRMERGEVLEAAGEARKARDETLAARDDTLSARDKTLSARDETLTARDEAKAHRLGAEEAERKAEEWAQTARDLSGGDVATRKEARGYVADHDVDPLAHDGLFPRLGAVTAVRSRESWRTDYGLGGGGAEAGTNSVVLVAESYTGSAPVTAVVSGTEYDAKNVSPAGEIVPNGTLIVRKGGEQVS